MADLSGTAISIYRLEGCVQWTKSWMEPSNETQETGSWWVCARSNGYLNATATALAPAHVPHLLAAIAEAQAWLAGTEVERG